MTWEEKEPEAPGVGDLRKGTARPDRAVTEVVSEGWWPEVHLEDVREHRKAR